jgi:hypothetical protein
MTNEGLMALSRIELLDDDVATFRDAFGIDIST